MIYHLSILDQKKTPVPHWPKVPFLKDRDGFDFHPGLNIIYGPNGSGKSTLLTGLAILMHVWQTNWPRVTKESVMLFNRPGGLATGLLLDHDGSPARYLGVDEPSFAPVGNGISTQELAALKTTPDMRGKASKNMSHGQASVARLVRFLKAKPERVRYSMSARKATKEWRTYYDCAVTSLKNTRQVKGKPKQQVILLDEVDRSLDFAKQAAVWKQLRLLAQDHQIIIASHSPFAVNVPGAHYIETTPDYLNNSRKALSLLLEAA